MINKKLPLISVVVAVYNGEKFLNICVDSIIDQSYKNIEIILVDDGSIDNSSKICDYYLKRDKRIKVIHKENGGVCSARNSGINISKGDYICIIDQDDWIENSYIEYLYSLINHYDVEVSMVPQVIFSTNDNYYYNEKRKETISKLYTGEDIACLMLNGLIEIGPWNKMISKKLLVDNAISFNTRLFGGEGYLFSIDCFMKAKKVAVGYKGIYHYRIDNYSSEMSKFRIRTALSSYKTVDILKEKYKNKTKKMDIALNFAEWDAYYVFLIKMIASNSIEKHKSEYKKWKRKLKKDISYLLKAQIPICRKIKYLIIVFFTTLFILFKRVKNRIIKNKKDRDYSKSK